MKKVSFIGSGNVATHLAAELDRNGYLIHQIISRNKEHAFDLAKRFGAYSSSNLGDLYTDIDFLIISVSDDEIEAVAQKVAQSSVIVLHTSGSVAMNVLSLSSKYGVLYPLQSLSKNRSVDFRKVPLLIEGSSESVLKQIDELAFDLSNKVVRIDSEARRKVHLAAVMVNNFSNHLFAMASDYMDSNGLPFNLLVPLIRETADKLERLSPEEAQTGPARRGDIQTIETHLKMLEGHPELSTLYREMTELIRTKYGS